MIRGRLEKRSSKSNKHRSKSISQSQSKFKCFHSHKKDCPERRGKDSKKSQEPRDVDIAQAGYETVNVLVVSNSKIEKDWVMDSSCTFHLCPRCDYSESMILNEGGVVMLGNNKPCKVQDMDSILLKMFNGQETPVRYVPELKRNLISINMFDALRYTTQIEHGMMKIFKNSMIIAKGIKMNGLYILDDSIVIAQIDVASQNQHDKTSLWHISLGHVNEKG